MNKKVKKIRKLKRVILCWWPIITFLIFIPVSIYLGSFQDKIDSISGTIIKYYIIGSIIAWVLFSIFWLIFGPILIKLLLRIFLDKEDKPYNNKYFQKRLKYYNLHLFFLFSFPFLLIIIGAFLGPFDTDEVIGKERYTYFRNYLEKYEQEIEQQKTRES